MNVRNSVTGHGDANSAGRITLNICPAGNSIFHFHRHMSDGIEYNDIRIRVDVNSGLIHVHYYVRTKKLELNGEMNPPLDLDNGTVQIVTGNGGASLKTVDPNHDGNGYMVESYIGDYGYCELTVDEDTLHLRHILRNGTVLDEEFYTRNTKPISTALDYGTTTPTAYRLDQNYPNPFNAMTIISYYLPIHSDVSLMIYDIAGREIYTLWDGFQSAGAHRDEWKAVDSNGRLLPSGIYFSRMQTGYYSRTMKMTILR